jgi:hypothetical protein
LIKEKSMIVYNVTTKVTQVISQSWLQWIKEVVIPSMISTGCFTHATAMKLLEIDDSEGPTYVIQYFAESISLYNNYIDKHATHMRQQTIAKWGDQFIAFRSVMQVIH